MAKSTTPRTPRTSARKPRAPKIAAPKLVMATRATDDHQEIALRAYELFLASGWQHGQDLDHWLQAEKEIRARRLTSAA